MIIPRKVVDRVKHFIGLNLYETQIWLALLSHGVATAGELAEAAGVPRSRSYDILESLSKKGLVVVKSEGRPLKYMSVAPKQGLDNLKRYYAMSSEGVKDDLEGLKESSVIGELSDIFRKGEMVMELPELIGLVREKNNVFAHLSTLLNRSKTSIKIMATPHDVSELNSFYMSGIKEAKSRGVKVQVLVPTGTDSGELAKYAEVREIERPISRSVVIDSKEALAMFMDPGAVHPTFDAGVWVNSTYVAKTMDRLFEEAWNE
ncbi:MAG: TrmB family transcriptional regulator [Candidatus Altiarchaeota archaeon]|nr:TrmB family transcriptional regulator [Candidatus Altiarchaeota archaeon]